MALWYIDPSITDAQESDSFVGQFGTGKLRNSWADVTWTAGDRYYQRADSTFTTAVGGPGRIGINANGTRSNPIYIGKYGIGGNPVVLDFGRRLATRPTIGAIELLAAGSVVERAVAARRGVV